MALRDTQSRIAEQLDTVRSRIERACRRASRRADEITLIGVTKTWPLDIVRAAIAAGIHDIGENRAQELVEKAKALPAGVHRWHMIGHLQRNKAKVVVRHAASFHALDSIRLARALDRHASEAGRILECFAQVNVSGEASKSGFDPHEVPRALDELVAFESLRIVGLMTLAAPAEDPEDVRPQFSLLRRLSESMQDARLSMGMSGDFEVAVEEGATHIRLGSALFGRRQSTT